MTENLKLTIKSDYLAGILQRVFDYEKLTPDQQKEYFTGKSMQESGEFLIGTFLWDVLRNGFQAGVELDMTYDTLDKLPTALRRCLQTYCDEPMALKKAADATARSFAAYLFALGMNEHDVKLKAVRKGAPFIKPDPAGDPLWGNALRITTGIDREKDFLIPALQGGSGFYREGKGLILLNVTPAIRAYKSAFGVDLAEHGLIDMALEADAKG